MIFSSFSLKKPEHVCGQQLNLIQEILQQKSDEIGFHTLQQQTSPTTNLTQQYKRFFKPLNHSS